MSSTSRYDTLIFDWDGTLINSIPRILACFERTFQTSGVAPVSAEAARVLIGIPLQDALRQLAGPDADVDAMTATYREIWLGPELALSPLFPGVPEMLGALNAAGFRIMVATGKSREGMERETGHYQLDRFFSHTRCAGESLPKPEPAMLHALVAESGADPARCLMIGDSALDLEMAARAGMDAVGVTSGAHGREALMDHAPRACFDVVTELRAWL